MAVDFAVPLITNVKCAKLLVEALVRRLPLDVSSVDYKTSHATHTFPGLVALSTFVPGLNSPASKDFAEVTKGALSSGFTTALVLPFGTGSQIVDIASLAVAHSTASGAAHCNYTLSVVATTLNVQSLDSEFESEVKSIFVPFNKTFSRSPMSQQIATVAAHFAAWPTDKAIITDAKGSDLASVLLLASLHNRSVHVTDVRAKEDLLLISLSKSKQLKVTCDVSVFALFFNRQDYTDVQCLPSKEDQQELWNCLEVIDAFSIGTLPYELASELGQEASPTVGIEDTLPLLLTAVAEGKLTLEAIQERLHDNPIRIFGLPEQSHTQVEVVVNRKAIFALRKSTSWSPVDRVKLTGAVDRVVIHGQTVYLDGALTSATPLGRDISSATITRPLGDRGARLSMSGPRPTNVAEQPSALNILPRTVDGLTPMQQGPLSLAGSQLSGGAVVSPNALAIASSPRVFSQLTPHPAFHRKNILSVKQFTHQDIHDLFALAHEMRLQVERSGTLDILKGKVLCTLFYEPSTRTSSSFDAAMKRCGGEVVQVSADRSSVLKGETLADTIRTLSCYADAIVIRHPDVGSSQTAAKFSPVPIINAGDGIGEHPTQVRHPS